MFCVVGYEETSKGVGSIKKATYNGHAINGMVYNRSLITNLGKLRVDFILKYLEMHYYF